MHCLQGNATMATWGATPGVPLGFRSHCTDDQLRALNANLNQTPGKLDRSGIKWLAGAATPLAVRAQPS